MASNGSIYRTSGPLGATTNWTLVYSQAGISISQQSPRHFVQDNAGRLWAFVAGGYLIYTTDVGANWTSVTQPDNAAYIAQYQNCIVCGSSSLDIYKWGTSTIDQAELITVQSVEARTGTSSYQINPQGAASLFEYAPGAESRQRIGFAFRYPASAPSGEIPLAAFARSLSTSSISQARRFNFQLTTGLQSGPTTTIGVSQATISASSTASTRYAYLAMNGVGQVGTANYWQSSVVTPTSAYLQLYQGSNFPKQQLIYYTLTCAINSSQSLMPTAWAVQGSNDGTNWTILDTRTDESGWSVNERRSYTLSAASEPYSYFRLDMTQTASGNTFYCVGDWGLYGISETDVVGFGEDATVGLYLDVTTKTLRVRGEDGGLWAESTIVLNPDLWYYLEFSHSASAGGNLHVEGMEACTWSNTSPAIEKLQLGAFAPNSAFYYIDDIALSEGETAPGPLKVYSLLPNGDGAYTGWDKSHVDMTRSEILTDGSDDTYLSSFSGTTSVFVDDLNVNRDVLGIQIVSRMSKEDAESGLTDVVLRHNAVNIVVNTIDPTQTPTWYSTLLETHPCGQVWTPNLVNDIEIGWTTVPSPPPYP